MKNLLNYPILVSVIAISACKSHKPVEAFNYSANDSCMVQTDLSVHSLSNIEKNESITTRLAQDHLDFSDGGGEITIHPNGEVSIKGLKSAHLMRYDSHKQSATTASNNDSITAKSQIKTAKTKDAKSKNMVTNPTSSSIWQKILLLIVLIIVFILSMRIVLKRFFN